MSEYAYCPQCGEKYNVSVLRDKNKVFICEDCVRRDATKMGRKKYKPIYDRKGMARVVYSEVEL